MHGKEQYKHIFTSWLASREPEEYMSKGTKQISDHNMESAEKKLSSYHEPVLKL